MQELSILQKHLLFVERYLCEYFVKDTKWHNHAVLYKSRILSVPPLLGGEFHLQGHMPTHSSHFWDWWLWGTSCMHAISCIVPLHIWFCRFGWMDINKSLVLLSFNFPAWHRSPCPVIHSHLKQSYSSTYCLQSSCSKSQRERSGNKRGGACFPASKYHPPVPEPRDFSADHGMGQIWCQELDPFETVQTHHHITVNSRPLLENLGFTQSNIIIYICGYVAHWVKKQSLPAVVLL